MGKTIWRSLSVEAEWLVLMEQIIDELDTAMNLIAQRPTRGLVRRGANDTVGENSPSRFAMCEPKCVVAMERYFGAACWYGGSRTDRAASAELTLDTMEHRWLRNQLIDIQRKLGRSQQSMNQNLS